MLFCKIVTTCSSLKTTLEKRNAEFCRVKTVECCVLEPTNSRSFSLFFFLLNKTHKIKINYSIWNFHSFGFQRYATQAQSKNKFLKINLKILNEKLVK